MQSQSLHLHGYSFAVGDEGACELVCFACMSLLMCDVEDDDAAAWLT